MYDSHQHTRLRCKASNAKVIYEDAQLAVELYEEKHAEQIEKDRQARIERYGKPPVVGFGGVRGV